MTLLDTEEGGFDEVAFARESGATADQVDALQTFQAMVEEWNGRINLMGPSAQKSFWRRHAWDSAQLFHVEQTARVWADVGAGAGFPGIVLAVMLKGQAGAKVHLIESMAKRVRFLDAVAERLSLPVQIHHARAEDVAAIPDLEIVTARACAPFPRLFGYTKQFFRGGARGLFLKGRDVEGELTEARRSWTFAAELLPSRSDPSGRLVRIERLAPRAR
jgi:16S rRNA (guanine527-N7)-methyltransferase